MRVHHTIHSIDRQAGGPSTYMQQLTGELATAIELSVSTLQSPEPLPLDPRITYFEAKKAKLGLFGYSPDIRRLFQTDRSDIFHGNGLWQYPVHAMARAARKRIIPLVISPHGMMEPWSMQQGKWKKQLALRLFQHKDLQSADVIHTTASMEADTLRALGYTNPMAVIPNGIDTREFFPRTEPSQKSGRQLLFLSRIHPKKGIELLINAWAAMSPGSQRQWKVKIAGNGEPGYIRELNELIERKGLGNSIHIVGPVFGAARKEIYQASDLFILPTHSENFGIVIAEALACGVPVITTKGAPWSDLPAHQCGWWINANLEELVATLSTALALSEGELSEMGQRGRKLIEEKYSIRQVGSQMIEMYHWLLDKTAKPAFIV